MKLSPYVKSVKDALSKKIITIDDVLQLYKDSYFTEKECKQILKGGFTNGIR